MKNNLEDNLKCFINELRDEVDNLNYNPYRSEEYRYVKILTLKGVIKHLEFFLAKS